MSKTREILYLSACEDCVAFAANGTPGDYPDAPTPEEHAARIREHLGITDLRLLVNASASEDEPGENGDIGEDWFSWSQCECCGSNLGGMRNRLALFNHIDKKGIMRP